jgi:hypothetical protein
MSLKIIFFIFAALAGLALIGSLSPEGKKQTTTPATEIENRALTTPTAFLNAPYVNVLGRKGKYASPSVALHLGIRLPDPLCATPLPLGLETVRQLRQKTKLQFDVHLMATANENFVDELLDIGVQQLIFHVETEPRLMHRFDRRRRGTLSAKLANSAFKSLP